jgi:RNA polymerase sigma-70 factor (ECF subfamily)
MASADSFSPRSLRTAELPATVAVPRTEAPATAVLDLKALFTTHYASIWRLLRRFGVQAAACDDAAQEVFWVAARRLADIEAGRERAFLYGVALRVAASELRARKSAVTVTELDDVTALVDCDQPSPEETLMRRQARELLDCVLDRLPIELRTVFVLFELEGLPLGDIAELERIPLGTASSRLRRARSEFSAIARRLRAILGRGGAPR